MKRTIAAITMILICVLSLCACTPKENKIVKKYEDNGYIVGEIASSTLTLYGIDTKKTEYFFTANNVESGLKTVYVVVFKKNKDAKELYKRMSNEKNRAGEIIVKLKYVVSKKGKAVIFGMEDAVKLA